jgi:predicted ATPase
MVLRRGARRAARLSRAAMAVIEPSAAGEATAARGLAGGAFVGRAREIRALGRCIDGGADLVTITGTAGIGKTRLAIEWARSAHGGGPREGGGVVFCDVSDAVDVNDACAALARALGVPLAAGGMADEAVARLGRALGEAAPRVVILDSMEQLASLAPRMLPSWRALAPRTRFVVTSRERLRLPGEAVIEVAPLGVPPEDERSPARIAASEAVALFVARARAARFDFELAEADASAVAAIVRWLDGLPLAIELCAARALVLAPDQMLARPARRFDLLVTGARGTGPRRATLRDAIDASWDLLDPWEKDTLAQCSIFRGAFSIEAAEAVLDLDAAAPRAPRASKTPSKYTPKSTRSPGARCM